VFSPARIDSRAYNFSGTTYRDAPVALPDTIAVTGGGIYEESRHRGLDKRTPLPGGTPLEIPDFLLVSDGGYPPHYQFEPRWIPGLASLALMWRANTIALEQVSALRRRMLVRMFEQQQPNGLLVALGSNVDRLPCAEADRYPLSVSSVLPEDRCNLRMVPPFGPREWCGPRLGPGLDRIRAASQQQFDQRHTAPTARPPDRRALQEFVPDVRARTRIQQHGRQ
jgi:hypothetical protein